MDILYKSCAGIDVHQAMIAVCVLHGSLTATRPKREEAQFDTTAEGLKECRDFLKALDVQVVGMESTGVYWKPIWHALCHDFELILANPAHMRTIPGKKKQIRRMHCGLPNSPVSDFFQKVLCPRKGFRR